MPARGEAKLGITCDGHFGACLLLAADPTLVDPRVFEGAVLDAQDLLSKLVLVYDVLVAGLQTLRPALYR